MKLIIIALCSSLLLSAQAKIIYNVVAKRLMAPDTIIAGSKGSAWGYNYNPAVYNVDDSVEMLVRGQNKVNQSVPFIVGPSYLGHSAVHIDGVKVDATQPKTNAFPHDPVTEKCGTEDPRIALLDDTYYLFYTAYDCEKAMLSLATSKDPADPQGWTRHGFVLPDIDWSKAGAPLFATKENGLKQHYLFWGDSTTPKGGVGVAVSKDGINWQQTETFLLQTRAGLFDSGLVEAGPSPLKLSTGDYLFIYNSARHGHPSVKPDWDLQYNLGFAILNKDDPLIVVQRSLVPLFSPVLDWEIGNTEMNLTPNVVFLEGLVPYPGGCPQNAREEANAPDNAKTECFFGAYGGADSDVGALQIIVTYIDLAEDSEEVINI